MPVVWPTYPDDVPEDADNPALDDAAAEAWQYALKLFGFAVSWCLKASEERMRLRLLALAATLNPVSINHESLRKTAVQYGVAPASLWRECQRLKQEIMKNCPKH